MAAQTVSKIQYENNVTVIGADNLNAIQDAVNNHAGLIDDLDNDKVDKVAGKGLSTNDFTTDAQSKLSNLPSGPQLDTSLGGKVDKRTSGTEVYTHTGTTQGGATLTETPTAGAVPLYGTGGVLKAAAPVADNDVVRKAELDDVKDNLNAAFVTNTASGAIASFPDGADGVPVKSLVVNVEPKQDLHGYENPWPAGGGKNKLKITVNTSTHDGVTMTVNRDTYGNVFSVSLNGTATAMYDFQLFDVTTESFVLDNATYYLLPVPSNVKLYLTISNNGTTRYIDASSAGTKSFTITDGDTIVAAFIRVESGATLNNLVVYPEIASENTTTFAPYSNICPISGWTGANVEQRGKNLLDVTKSKPVADGGTTTQNGMTFRFDSATGTFVLNGTATNTAFLNLTFSTGVNNSMRVDSLVGKTLTLTCDGITGTDVIYMQAFKSDGTYYSIGTFGNTTGSRDFEVTSEMAGLRFYYQIASGTTHVNTVIKPMIRLASDTDPTFAPYSGQSLSVTFPTAAGTVYGGTLDITNGVLTVTHGYMSALWSTGRDEATSDTIVRRRFPMSVYSAIGDLRADSKSNIAPYINGSTMNKVHYQIMSGGNGVFFFLPVGTAEDTEVALYYRLAEPVTYQLTPQEVTTLLGTNNIWADCGDTSVTYAADIKLYIEQLTKPTEDDMTADHAISAGTFFMIGNNLYLATSQIAAGGTITPGTNATQLSLADALNQVNA